MIESEGGEATYAHCDATSSSDIGEMVKVAVDTYGGLDIFVNSAGIYRGGGRMHELSIDDVQACWNVVVKGSWFGCQQAISHLLLRG